MIVLDTYDQLKKFSKIDCVCTIGNFDGVHKAHQKLLGVIKRTAASKHARSLVITFKNHPHQVGKKKKKPILTSLEHKLFLLKRSGVDLCFVFSFNSFFKNLSPEKFLQDILFKKFSISELIIGYNFRFGRNREGNAALVRRHALRRGIKLVVQKPLKIGDVRVSSSLIRSLVSRGKLIQAQRLLGRKYSVFANVVKGRGRGTLLGFPTANLDLHSEVMPPTGVYIVKVNIWDINFKKTKKGTIVSEKLINENVTGVCNLGYTPTFGDVPYPKAEVHFPGLKADFKDKLLEVTFYHKIRNEKKFPTVSKLKKQIEHDVKKAVLYFG